MGLDELALPRWRIEISIEQRIDGIGEERTGSSSYWIRTKARSFLLALQSTRPVVSVSELGRLRDEKKFMAQGTPAGRPMNPVNRWGRTWDPGHPDARNLHPVRRYTG